MTLSASQGSDDETGKGTALTPAFGGGVDPFIARVDAEPVAPRAWYARLLDYSAHAAMIVGLIGFAWTVSDHVVPRETAAQIEGSAPVKVATAATIPAATTPSSSTPATSTEPVVKQVDDIADLRRANQKLATEIKSLHANLDTMRETLSKVRSQDDFRALSARIDEVKAGVNAAKSQTDAHLADLSGKVEAMRQATTKAQQIAKLERQAPDIAPTGSIQPEPRIVPETRVGPKPPAKPTSLAASDDTTKDTPAKPQVIAGWVVRDVYDGVAIIEGRRGPMEVVPGVSIPGAGVVKSIDRHGAGWTITTTKGLVAYAAPPRDYRRVQARESYPGYRYDF